MGAGELLGFIGPNAAGKSTTIKMLTGILHPTGGEAKVLGFIPWKEWQKLPSHIGTVFGQRPQLWYHLPAIDTFTLFRKIFEMDDCETRYGSVSLLKPSRFRIYWYPVERLAKLGNVALQQPSEEFPYIPIAFAEFCIREIRGSQDNPRILESMRSTDLSRYPSLPDETKWCAAFVNWCIERVGLPSTNSAVVSPWMNWGVKPPSMRRGCVVTFRWEDGWDHISFYLGEVGNYVICLGGNQSDAVWISVYHIKYITSFRIP